jgi:uncharacterized protein YoxC
MDLSLLQSFEQLQTAVYMLVLLGAIPVGMWARSVHGTLADIRSNTAQHHTDIAVLQTEVSHLTRKVDALSGNPINHNPGS